MNGISLSTYQQCCILTVFFIFLRKRWYHRYSSAGQRRIAMDLACKIQARIGTRRAHGSCFNGKKPYLPFRSLIIYNNYMPKCWVDLSSNLRGIIDFFCLGQNKSRSVQFNVWGRVYASLLTTWDVWIWVVVDFVLLQNVKKSTIRLNMFKLVLPQGVYIMPGNKCCNYL